MNLALNLLRGIAERNRATNPHYAERIDAEIEEIIELQLATAGVQTSRVKYEYWLNPQNLLVISDRSKWGNPSLSTYPKFSLPCRTWADVLHLRDQLESRNRP